MLTRRDLLERGVLAGAAIAIGHALHPAPVRASGSAGLTDQRRAVYSAVVTAVVLADGLKPDDVYVTEVTVGFDQWYGDHQPLSGDGADSALDALAAEGFADLSPGDGMKLLREWLVDDDTTKDSRSRNPRVRTRGLRHRAAASAVVSLARPPFPVDDAGTPQTPPVEL